jgi:hypothetical protein
MSLKPSTDWTVVREDERKRVSMRYVPSSDEVEFMEEFFEDVPLTQAAQERELFTPKFAEAMRPMATIPQSVLNQSIKEGWVNDDAAWRKWMNDADNNKLRIAGGTA